MEKEHRAAIVRERDKLVQACLEQYDEDQEVLRWIEARRISMCRVRDHRAGRALCRAVELTMGDISVTLHLYRRRRRADRVPT